MTELYMDAEIRPNRSLTRKGFIILISLLTAINCITAVVFVQIGAAFVPVFLGMDLLAVIVAFIASFRAAERVERVQITAAEVRVIREWRRQAETVWISPTDLTRMTVVERDDDDELVQLRLADRRVTVARALSPKERADFARALDRALWRARRARMAGT
jgi:uncharacterized membrane protein